MWEDEERRAPPEQDVADIAITEGLELASEARDDTCAAGTPSGVPGSRGRGFPGWSSRCSSTPR